MLHKKTKKEFNQDIVNDYIDAFPGQPIDMHEVATWAIKNNRWEMPSRSVNAACAQDLSDAVREEYHTDPQGRRVRSKHAYLATEVNGDGKKVQKHLWAELESLTPNQARLSFGHRRKHIEGECIQLYTDECSYNDNNPHGDVHQTCFDFTDCVEESQGSDEYDPQ